MLSFDFVTMPVQRQISRVRRALAYEGSLLPEEMLLIRDMQGRVVPRQPTGGVVPRTAAVLLLLYPFQNDLWFPLTVRSKALTKHRGEVSLPGGAIDPEDATLEATALRETDEELGIDPATVQVWGGLSPFYIPASNFELHPVVGYVQRPPAFIPNPAEIDCVLYVSLSLLLDRSIVLVEEWQHRGTHLQVPFFAIEGYKVWGATALVLSELVARIRRTDQPVTPRTRYPAIDYADSYFADEECGQALAG